MISTCPETYNYTLSEISLAKIPVLCFDIGAIANRVKKYKIGRLYVVINPNIKNGKFETNDQIFEYNDVGLDNSTYVEKWIMQRLNVAKSFIQANNLFDLLTYEIKKIDDYDNFLFIMMPITLPDVLKYMKKIFISLGVMAIISLILVLTI